MLHQKNLEFDTEQELRKEKRKGKITKADIVTPMNFKHIAHISWNPNTGYDVFSEDAQLKSLCQKAGVTEKQLQDKETRKFIYDFVHKYGVGIDTAMESEGDSPAVPSRGPPSHSRPGPSPPPVMKRNQTQNTPMDLKHTSHVGWSPNIGSDVFSEDAQLKSLFQKAGVTEKQLQDKETRKFIYDFVHKYGVGIDTAMESEGDSPAIPSRGPPSHSRPGPSPPPVMKRNQTQNTPMDLKHTSHVGWTPNIGSDVFSEDAQLISLLQKAGISEKQLQDKETRKFIYDFIHIHGGGIDTVLESERDPPTSGSSDDNKPYTM